MAVYLLLFVTTLVGNEATTVLGANAQNTPGREISSFEPLVQLGQSRGAAPATAHLPFQKHHHGEGLC